jgi:hypothetical protein
VSVQKDRLEYSSAIAHSWREQMLLNLVKLRYGETPTFVEVSQIVSGYALEKTLRPKLGVSGLFVPHMSTETGVTGEIGGELKYTERPVITYTPLTGERFARTMLKPLDVSSLLHLIEAGWDAEFLLLSGAQCMNGLRNGSRTHSLARKADKGFLRATVLLRRLQLEGMLGMRFNMKKKPPEVHLLFFKRKDVTPEAREALAELKQILKLDPKKSDFNAAYGAFQTANVDLAIQTRSFFHIMTEFASYVEPPAQHIAEERASSLPTISDGIEEGSFSVKSGKQRPKDCYKAVRYRDHWFWLEDKDAKAKRSFQLLLMLQHMLESKEGNVVPIVTIPAG